MPIAARRGKAALLRVVAGQKDGEEMDGCGTKKRWVQRVHVGR
jgi:hypothetical protein